MCVCIYVCERACVYFGGISSLIHISLNNIDIFYLHIFVYILSICHVDFIVSEIDSIEFGLFHSDMERLKNLLFCCSNVVVFSVIIF